MKIVVELLLTIMLIVHVLVAVLSTNVANLLVGVVCYLWAWMMVEGPTKE